ncbi:MAG TPA: EAL domain-containing protein [Beijerinckiaceae bacterium]
MPSTLGGPDLLAAIRSGEMDVVYQPQVTAADARFVGVEALARWNHPTRGALSPAAFLEAGARSPALSALGDFVLQRACEAGARWRSLRMSVNVSPHQFQDPRLAERVVAIARAAAMPLERLELEILEDCWFEDLPRARLALQRLRGSGVQIALDDFGAGYSSLSVLFDLPLDKIKLDRSFTCDPVSGATSTKIPEIVALARAVGLSVTAEGVETEAQRAYLAAAGCDYLQGYLFARPLSADAIDAILAA